MAAEVPPKEVHNGHQINTGYKMMDAGKTVHRSPAAKYIKCLFLCIIMLHGCAKTVLFI